jgi:hypothetical protein
VTGRVVKDGRDYLPCLDCGELIEIPFCQTGPFTCKCGVAMEAVYDFDYDDDGGASAIGHPQYLERSAHNARFSGGR